MSVILPAVLSAIVFAVNEPSSTLTLLDATRIAMERKPESSRRLLEHARGLLTSAFLTLEIIPVVYTYWRLWQLRHGRLPIAERRVALVPEHERTTT